MRIPSVITAGDSVSWTDVSTSDQQNRTISSATHSLIYAIRGAISSAAIDIVAAPSGSGWASAITGVQSAALNTTAAPQNWSWQAYATQGSNRTTIGSGTLRVLPNLTAIGTYDGRSQTERDLDAIRAEMAARIEGGATLEYTIGTRSLKKEPMASLLQMEQRCLRIIAREKRAAAAANGLGNPGRTLVRF